MTAPQSTADALTRRARELELARWHDSYVNHSSVAVRRRALAAGNGHAAEVTQSTREKGR